MFVPSGAPSNRRIRHPGLNLDSSETLTRCLHHHPTRSRLNCRPTVTMGITEFFSDVWETFALPSADAEAPPQGGTSTETPASGTDEESSEEAEVNKQDAKGSEESEEQGHRPSDGGDDEEEAEDEEEEEEEYTDPKEVLEEGE